LRSIIGLENPYALEGAVGKGWEEVQAAYEEIFKSGWDCGSQLVVYHEGEVVVDLCGRNESSVVWPGTVVSICGKPYNSDTLQCVFSSSKFLEALAITMAVDRGWCDFSDPLVKHWPKFAEAGTAKASITIAHVLRHDSGLHCFADPVTEAVIEDHTAMSALIERSDPQWAADTRRVYHGVTRGWVLSCLLQRVDPACRTMGRFLQEEVFCPLQVSQSYYIGTPLPTLQSGEIELCLMDMEPWWHTFCNTTLPMGIRYLTGQLTPEVKAFIQMTQEPQLARMHQAIALESKGPHRDPELAGWNSERVLAAEISSSNGIATVLTPTPTHCDPSATV